MKFISICIMIITCSNVYAQKEHKYPLAIKGEFTQEFFGEKVDDPYQWMEKQSIRLDEWLEAQQKIKRRESGNQIYMEELEGEFAIMIMDVEREKTNAFVKKETIEFDKYEFDERFGTNWNRSPDLWFKLRGSQNYSRLIRAKDFLSSKEDHLVIRSIEVNPNLDLAMIKISINGSDWETGYVFDLDSKVAIDTLDNLRIGHEPYWHGTKLYYVNYDVRTDINRLIDKAPNQRLVTKDFANNSGPNSQTLFINPDTTGTNPFRYFIKDDKLFLKHYLKIKGNYYRALSVADLNSLSFFPRNFLIYPNKNNIDLNVEFMSGDTIYLSTNWNAPNQKVLIANLNEPNKLKELIPEFDVKLANVNRLGKDKIACVYLHEGRNIAMIFRRDGELLKTFDFPVGKKINGLYESDEEADFTNFSVSSFYHPSLNFQIHFNNLDFKPVETLSVPYDANDFETRYVNYPSKDGTLIPMYITCKKNIELNENNPVLIYGYGGYGNTVEPFFDRMNAVFLLRGGILAIPNVRGGGAKGDLWAQEGRRLKKQNTIDDFVYAAEYLINEGYSNPKKIGIMGGSHGGLLVGAAITQRPDLFEVAIAEAGVFDMLRFENFTVGSVNTNIHEYGTTDNLDDYKNLKSYSPYHNIKKGIQYPNVLLVTGDNDDRVPPLHSYKFLARLQELGDPKRLYHLYLTPGSSHSGALTIKDWYQLEHYKYYFLMDKLGMIW